MVVQDDPPHLKRDHVLLILFIFYFNLCSSYSFDTCASKNIKLVTVKKENIRHRTCK